MQQVVGYETLPKKEENKKPIVVGYEDLSQRQTQIVGQEPLPQAGEKPLPPEGIYPELWNPELQKQPGILSKAWEWTGKPLLNLTDTTREWMQRSILQGEPGAIAPEYEGAENVKRMPSPLELLRATQPIAPVPTGVLHGATETAESLTSPRGIGTIAAIGPALRYLPKAVSMAGAFAFGGEMAIGGLDAWLKANEAAKSGAHPQEVLAMRTQAVTSLLMAYGMFRAGSRIPKERAAKVQAKFSQDMEAGIRNKNADDISLDFIEESVKASNLPAIEKTRLSSLVGEARQRNLADARAVIPVEGPIAPEAKPGPFVPPEKFVEPAQPIRPAEAATVREQLNAPKQPVLPTETKPPPEGLATLHEADAKTATGIINRGGIKLPEAKQAALPETPPKKVVTGENPMLSTQRKTIFSLRDEKKIPKDILEEEAGKPISLLNVNEANALIDRLRAMTPEEIKTRTPKTEMPLLEKQQEPIVVKPPKAAAPRNPEKSLANAVNSVGGINPKELKDSGLSGEWEMIDPSIKRLVSKPGTRIKLEEAAREVNKLGYQIKDGADLLEKLRVVETAKKGIEAPKEKEYVKSWEEWDNERKYLQPAKREPLISKVKPLGEFAKEAGETVGKEREKAVGEVQAKIMQAPETRVSKREQLGLEKKKSAKKAPGESMFEEGGSARKLFKDESGFVRLSKEPLFKDNQTVKRIADRIESGRKKNRSPIQEQGEAEAPLSPRFLDNVRSHHHVLGEFSETRPIAKEIVQARRNKFKDMQNYDDTANKIIKEFKIGKNSPEDAMVRDLLDEASTKLTPEKLRASSEYKGNKESAIAAARKLRRDIFEPIITRIRNDPELIKIIGKKGYIRGYFPHMAKQLQEKYGKDWLIVARSLLPEQFTTRYLKERTAEAWDADISIYDALPAYISGTMRTIHDIPAYQKALNVLKGIPQSPLKEYAQFYADAYMSQPATKSRMQRIEAYQKVSRWVARRYYDNLIGLSWRTWGLNLMQTVSNTFPELGNKFATQGIRDLMSPQTRQKFHDSGLLFDSPGMESGMITAGIKHKILHGGMSGAEYINRGIAYLGGLRKAESLGLKGEAAENYAMDIVDKTQFSYTKDASIYFLERLSPHNKVFMTFKLKEAEYVRNLVKDAYKGGKEERAKLYRFLIINAVLPTLIASATGSSVDKWFISIMDTLPSGWRTGELGQKFIRWLGAVEKGFRKTVTGAEYPKGTRIVGPAEIPIEILEGLYDAFFPGKRAVKDVRNLMENKK